MIQQEELPQLDLFPQVTRILQNCHLCLIKMNASLCGLWAKRGKIPCPVFISPRYRACPCWDLFIPLNLLWHHLLGVYYLRVLGLYIFFWERGFFCLLLTKTRASSPTAHHIGAYLDLSPERLQIVQSFFHSSNAKDKSLPHKASHKQKKKTPKFKKIYVCNFTEPGRILANGFLEKTMPIS